MQIEELYLILKAEGLYEKFINYLKERKDII